MSGSTSSGHPRNFETDAIGQEPPPAVQKKFALARRRLSVYLVQIAHVEMQTMH
jgi:hypothetical protein